jgi:hypothetical protein
MMALPNAKSTLTIAINTVTRPYADAAATTQETVSRVSSSNLSYIDDDGELLCLPARGAFLRSSSLLHFLSSSTDKCMGNRGPGSMEYSATTGRLGLSLLGLEGESLGSGALRHATTTINSSLALGDNGFRPKRLAERSIA